MSESMTENQIAAEFGMRMQEEFLKKNGRLLPKDDVEFGGMLGIAFMLGRESLAGAVQGLTQERDDSREAFLNACARAVQEHPVERHSGRATIWVCNPCRREHETRVSACLRCGSANIRPAEGPPGSWKPSKTSEPLSAGLMECGAPGHRYWRDANGMLHCKHGVILYGTKCLRCEQEGA